MSSSDVSGVTKYFSKANEGFSTTTSGTISASASSVGLNNTTGLTNGDVFVGIIEPGATAQQTFTGTVDISGSQITNVVWVRGTNVGHAGGVTVVDYVSGASHSMMTTGLLKQHTQAGAHTGITTDTIIVTSGSTLPAGDIGTADIANAAVTNAKIGTDISPANFSNPYKFYVYRNAAWTSGLPGVVNFDTKVFDTGNNVDIVTNKGRFTAPVNGFYHFDSSIGFTVVPDGTANIAYLYKNGSLAFRGTQFTNRGVFDQSATVSGMLQLVAGDYIEVYAYNGQAGGVSSAITFFQGFLVSTT